MNYLCRTLAAWLWVVGAALSGCALGPSLDRHGFGFDVRQSYPRVEILDYRYGNSRQPGARADPEWKALGKVDQQSGVYGDMLRGDELYVKWRIKDTGEVCEDTVDLKQRLPRNISDHEITFDIVGKQLKVYLVSPERRSPDMPPNGPREFKHLKVYTLYPDATSTK